MPRKYTQNGKFRLKMEKDLWLNNYNLLSEISPAAAAGFSRSVLALFDIGRSFSQVDQ